MKYHQFHVAAQAEWEAQRKRIADAVAQCDHVATPEEVAAARALPQGVIKGRKNA